MKNLTPPQASSSIEWTLPAIYSELARSELALRGHIQPQQYDDFIECWRNSSERACVLANCRHYAERGLTDGRLLLPVQRCASDEWGDDQRLRGRSEALADSIGEFLWMMAGTFGVLPILEIATPLGQQEVERLNALQQPWVSLYFPTCSVYFVRGEHGQSAPGTIPNGDDLVGWVDELYIADYGAPYSTEGAAIPHDWRAYEKRNSKIPLPNYFDYPEYFTKHKTEIVAGYVKVDSTWKLVTINGLAHSKKDDAIRKLFGASEHHTFSEAVRRNVEDFRPQLLARKGDSQILVDCLDHQQARQLHSSALGRIVATYAITLAHSLVTSSEHASHQPHASSFLTCLISAPEFAREKLMALLNSRDARGESFEVMLEREWSRVVGLLWDNIDILKFPISRQMMLQANDELRLERAELRRRQTLLDALTDPVERLSKSLSRAVAEMTKLQGIYKWSIRGAYERAPLIAPIFKANASTLLDEAFCEEGNHHGWYLYEQDARLALRGVIFAWLGHDLTQKPTTSTDLDALYLSLIDGTRGDRDVNQLLAAAIRAAGPVPFTSFNQWELDHFNRALSQIKRQLHTNLKSFTDSEVTISDLVFALPKLKTAGQFERTQVKRTQDSPQRILLRAGRNPLPRVIDFVEFISSLIVATAPDSWNKDDGFVATQAAGAVTIAAREGPTSNEAEIPDHLVQLLSKRWKSEMTQHLDASLGDLLGAIVGMMRLCCSKSSPELVPSWDGASRTATFKWTLREGTPLTIQVDLRNKRILIGG
jgi:hypothetical protein